MSPKSPAKTRSTPLDIGRRLSYDGSLCTVRWIGQLPATKGERLGVEWDDPSRGKHNGIYQGKRIFDCLRKHDTPASFVKRTRVADPERTVLEAIKFKYGDTTADQTSEVVIISGKVAEEVGFAKVAEEQARLSDLKIVLIDQLVVNGIAPRGSSRNAIAQAQGELAAVCPNIEELDIGFNAIQTWRDVADICATLPKLTRLRVGLRLSSFSHNLDSNPFSSITQLYLDGCLITSSNIAELLVGFTNLRMLSLASNQLNNLLSLDESIANGALQPLSSLESLYLDNNEFQDLNCISHITKAFPNARIISLEFNKISSLGQQDLAPSSKFPQVKELNLRDNQIPSINFLDSLSTTFPNLTSLRVSGNPFYILNTAETDPRPSDKLFYLSLARIPTLKQLNFGNISTKDREEGEIYYLSIVGQEIQTLLTANANPKKKPDDLAKDAISQFPHYQSLCEKYARESIIDQFLSSPESSSEFQNTLQKQQYLPGSLGARLVTATFYISTDHATSMPTVTQVLPLSLPVMFLMAHLCRHPTFKAHLAPLQFNLIYKSTEFDPVDTTTESTTRSKLYARGYRPTKEEKVNLWKEWGDWDADAIVEEEIRRHREKEVGDKGGQRDKDIRDQRVDASDGREHQGTHQATVDEHWTKNGTLMRDGREWKRREVMILHSVRRPWGDWIDIASGGPERTVKVRIEPLKRSGRK